MQKQIYDTSLPQNWSKRLYEELLYDINPQHFEKIVGVAFIATAEILNKGKSLDTPMVMTYKSLNGQHLVSAICQYFDNANLENPGNYSLVFTFNQEDIPENAHVETLDNLNTHAFFTGVAGSKYNFRFDSSAAIVSLATTTFEEIRKWLDENAKESEEVCIECPGIFQARVAVENGEKVFAIEPAGEIKMLIKNDSSIEK